MNKANLRRIAFFSAMSAHILLFGSAQSQWVRQINGLPSDTSWTGRSIDARDSNTVVLALNNSLFRTVDGGTNWIEIGQLRSPVDVSIIDSLHIWVATDSAMGGQYDAAIYATADGGQHWARQYHIPATTGFMNYVKMFDLQNGVAMGDPPGPATGPTLFLTTSDGGEHWVSVNDSALGWSANTWANVSFVNPTVGYFFGNGISSPALFRTTTGGGTWTRTTTPFHNAMVLKFHDEYLGMAFPVTYPSQDLIYQTTDGGVTWNPFHTGTTAWIGDIEFAVDDPSRVWMVDPTHVYFSSDTGKTWQQQLAVPWLRFAGSLTFADSRHGWWLADGHLYATSNGGDPPSAVRDQSGGSPITFALEQNFPNPFNPTTGIGYRLRNKEFVTLKVYDILGREVAALVNETKEPGSYRVSFDARGLASGIYVYRITAGTYVESRRMLLLR